MIVRLFVRVKDVFASLLFDACFGGSLVDEVQIIPHVFRDDFEADIAARDGAELLDELVTQGLFVEEDDRVVELLVEVLLPRFNGLFCTC